MLCVRRDVDVCVVRTHVTETCESGSALGGTCNNDDISTISNDFATLLSGSEIQSWNRVDVDSTLHNAGFRLVHSAIINTTETTVKRYVTLTIVVLYMYRNIIL
jgi:hypothetical protein